MTMSEIINSLKEHLALAVSLGIRERVKKIRQAIKLLENR